VPNWSIKRVLATSRAVNQALEDSKLVWEHLDERGLRIAEAAIRRVLKLPREIIPEVDEDVLSNDFANKELCIKEAIRSVLMPYAGMELSPQTVVQISRHVSGWAEGIKQGEVFKPWDPAEGPSWGLLYVTHIERLLRDRYYYKCVIESRAGDSVGMQWQPTYSGPYIQRVLREIGASRYNKYLAEDFSGLWFMALMDYRRGHLAFRETITNNSQVTANRSLLKLRQGYCYKGHFETKCYNCHLGKQHCPASRHRETYPEGHCRNDHPGFIVKAGYCLACISSGRFETERKAHEQTSPRNRT
jgi:hypothetical protein